LTHIKHYPVNDFAYSIMLQESMSVLASNALDFDNPNVFEIIEIFNISLFFKDEQYLNERGKNLLNTNRRYFSRLMKAQNIYFKDIELSKLESDFSLLKESLSAERPYTPSDYFEALSSNIDFSKCQSDVGEICFKYVPLSFLLMDKKFVNSFSDQTKKKMLSNPQSFCLLVHKYDDASSRVDYHFPDFSDSEINDLIEGYLTSTECDSKVLNLAILHRDSSETYRIKRKTRLKISQKLVEKEKEFFDSENVISMPVHHDYGFVVSSDQKALLAVKKENEQTVFSFSKGYYIDADSWEKVLDRLLYCGVLINQFDSISNLYNPYKESVISKIFEAIHVTQYGSQTYQTQNALNQTFFDFLYSNFAHVNKSFENLALWVISEKINPLLGGSKLNLTFANVFDVQIRCEHLFNQIASLLLQYRIFVEEGEITPDLIEETRDSLQIRDLPSLVKDKYYDINPSSSDAKHIMFLLFSDQAGIRYVNKELNADSFFNLITQKNVPFDTYEGRSKQEIDYLVEHSILKIDGGILNFQDFETSFIWKFIYDNLFISSYLVDENVIRKLEHYSDKKILRKYSRLFSSAEADYLDFILNNSKFSNALALRNHYEHGQTAQYKEKEHEENYMIGLRILLIILIKIYKDLFEQKQSIKID
jgi:hypothetical protein